MRIIAAVAILCAATAVAPRWALAQSKLAFRAPQEAAANQPEPRVYHFRVGATDGPQASPREAQPASFQQAAPLEWQNDGPVQRAMPPTSAVEDASVLMSPGVTYVAPPVWETAPSWGFHTFAHTSCTCPTYDDDPWCDYCAERWQRYRRRMQREQCQSVELPRWGRAPWSPTPGWVGETSNAPIVIRDGTLRAPTPVPDAVPGPRRPPKNELPTPAGTGGRGRN